MRANHLNIGIGAPAGMPFEDAAALVKEAEEAGFYNTGFGESARDAFVLMAALACNTSRMKLVNAIATWTRTPISMMRACRDLQILSHGRFMLGIGSMPQSWNRDHYGIDPERPLGRMREYVDLVRNLYAAARDVPFNYAGQFYVIKDYRPYEDPPQYPLRVLIGASRPNMFRYAGAESDGVLFNRHTLPWLKAKALPPIEEGVKKAGRSMNDLYLQAGSSVIFTEDKAQARAAMDAFRRSLARVHFNVDYHQELMIEHGFAEEVAVARRALKEGDREALIGAFSDEMVRAYHIIGTVDECLEQVAKYRGVLDTLQISTPLGKTPQEKSKAYRRLIDGFKDMARG